MGPIRDQPGGVGGGQISYRGLRLRLSTAALRAIRDGLAATGAAPALPYGSGAAPGGLADAVGLVGELEGGAIELLDAAIASLEAAGAAFEAADSALARRIAGS